MKRRLLWQIYPVFMVMTLIGLLAFSWNVSVLLREFYKVQKTAQLERMARVATHYFEDIVGTEQFDKMQSVCTELGRTTQLRYTLIDLEGKVLADSDENPRQMENHLMRPEVQAVLDGRIGSDIRPSKTVKQELLYVGLPLTRDGKTAAVLRIAVPLIELRNTTQTINREIIRYGVIIAIVLAALSLALSWKISRPLEILRLGALRFAQGDLNHRLHVPASREIGALAESMNQMAAQMDERIRTIVAQRNQQQAMLGSMVEGVLAVNTAGSVLSANRAAAQMLQIAQEQCVGRTIEEVIRNTELQQFVRRILDNTEPAEYRITLHENIMPERHIQAHGTPLLGDSGSKIGALVVLNDITSVRRLEEVRRDFVANVSHELKTPVTSIKGFIETLLDGAMEDPGDRRRFLEIIARQANRLDSIIDDLLTLSRIEQQSRQEQMTLESAQILPILQAAAELCQGAAAEKNIRIEVDCPKNLQSCVNASLLEQAVVNLVDNAVKYSDTNAAVRVEALFAEGELLIHVRDRGCGIAKEHLPRLFERFYRVDKARSRKLGGTGLGLSIVKHIVQSHKGRISVESRPGEGSVFTLHLPRTQS
ncbi:MAG: PAS domain-containing protein [Phycisphaerae bacterium]|nr:PAS domain-containing protein [Phycisphaerae bacterium]